MKSLPADGLSPMASMENFLQKPLPETLEELEEEVTVISEMQTLCEKKIRELISSEKIEEGIVFPQEIHELHQQKNMLETHKQYRRVRINRLRQYKGI